MRLDAYRAADLSRPILTPTPFVRILWAIQANNYNDVERGRGKGAGVAKVKCQFDLPYKLNTAHTAYLGGLVTYYPSLYH